MNRRTLREQIYTRTGFDTQDSMVTAPVVNAAINDALHYIEVVHDWPWLESTETLTTTSGTNYVTPGSTWMRTKSLTLGDGNSLNQVAIADFDLLGTSGSGSPEQYAIHGGKIYLYPTPSDSVTTLTHRFISMESDLTDDSASPLLPASFQPALVELAASVILARVRDEDRALQAKQRYLDWERVMHDNRRRYSQPQQIRVRPGSFI